MDGAHLIQKSLEHGCGEDLPCNIGRAVHEAEGTLAGVETFLALVESLEEHEADVAAVGQLCKHLQVRKPCMHRRYSQHSLKKARVCA